MRTRSQSRNLHHQQQQAPPAVVGPFNLEEPIENPAPPLVPMADNRTMAQLLQAPTEGYEDAIVIPEINANFELKHGFDSILSKLEQAFFRTMIKRIRMLTSVISIRYTTTDEFPPEVRARILLRYAFFFPFFRLDSSARIWLEKEPPRSILTWDDLIRLYALNANDPDTLNSASGGNFLDMILVKPEKYREPSMDCKQSEPPGLSLRFKIIKTVLIRIKEIISTKPRKLYSQSKREITSTKDKCINHPTSQPPDYQELNLTNLLCSQVPVVSKPIFENHVKANDAVLRNMQNQGQGLQNQIANLTDSSLNFVNAKNRYHLHVMGTLPINKLLTRKEDLKVNEPPEVELKYLPPHLEYAFLEGNDKLPVIIAKDLKSEEKAALIEALKSHKRAIA
ncbi:hypothetical protein Tco_0950801 [Tanacetum coccineum]